MTLFVFWTRSIFKIVAKISFDFFEKNYSEVSKDINILLIGTLAIANSLIKIGRQICVVYVVQLAEMQWLLDPLTFTIGVFNIQSFALEVLKIVVL